MGSEMCIRDRRSLWSSVCLAVHLLLHLVPLAPSKTLTMLAARPNGLPKAARPRSAAVVAASPVVVAAKVQHLLRLASELAGRGGAG